MNKRLKVAQIGVRHEHADGKMLTARRQMSDVIEMVGIAAENPAEEAKHRNDSFYQGLPWMSREELLNLPGLDAVFVETEMTELVSTARMCLERRLPVHIDKPGGETLEPYAALVRDFAAAGVILQPGYMMRGSIPVNFMKRAVRAGWLGEIFEIDGNMHRYDVNPDFRRWLSGYPGGGMFDFGSHIIDILLDVMGAPDEVVPFMRRLGSDALNDNTLTVFTYPKAIATLRVAQISPNAMSARRFTIRGTKGMIEIDPLEQGYENYPKFNSTPVDLFLFLSEDNAEYKAGAHHLRLGPMTDRYEDQLREFVRLVRGEAKNPYTPEYEIQLQKLILAASGYLKWGGNNI